MNSIPTIQSKLPETGTTIFTIMSGLAAEYGAINLSQGFPGFSVSAELIELVNKHMSTGKNQYAPMAGVSALREEIALLQRELFNVSFAPTEEITITAGATQAIYTAISAFVQNGDEVIILSPSYDCYGPAVQVNGGTVKYVELNAKDYSIPWDKVEEAISPKTKMILLNSPHNPTGAAWSSSDLKQLEELVSGTDIIVLSDEVYAHIIFDGEKHVSLAESSVLRNQSLIVHSFGKTFHATGWKIGYILGATHLMAEFRKVHQYLVFSVNTPIQHALAEYIRNRENIYGLSAFYQEKRDYFLDLIKPSRFTFAPAAGSYFQLLSYENISHENDVEIAKKWTKEKGIAAIPISVFYPELTDNKMLRFCFAKEKDELKKAAEILCQI